MRHLATLTLVGAVMASGAQAANITPDTIFGSGNANGAFTVGDANGVEIGLRGKLRYNTLGSPESTYNYDGGDTYTFAVSDGNAPSNRSIFNWDWSINTTGSGKQLDDFTYSMSIDFDPTVNVGAASFDPINVAFADHAIGTNATPNDGGVEATDASSYAALIAANTVTQNSWNLGFFLALAPAGFDPQTEGLYTISLSAFDTNGLVSSSSIDIQYGNVAPIPVPAALPLMAGGLALLGLFTRRRRG